MIIQYTIETRWAHGGYSGEFEMDDADLEGLSEVDRDCRIEEAVNDAVANDVSWGWQVKE